jgi:hypothetical protein
MIGNDVVSVVLEAFAAIEARDEERMMRILHPNVEFHWPESLRVLVFAGKRGF